MRQSIDTIKINIAYDDINKPNLYQYDIRPEWIIDIKNMSEKYLMPWLHIDKFLGNQLQTFNVQSLEYFSSSEEFFIYPITLYCNYLFEKYETINLNDTLINSIKNKKAKIVFFYITEGWFGEDVSHYNWLDNLVTKYNLEQDDLIMITSNLLAKENYKGNKFTIIPYNYFTDELYFARIKKKDERNIEMFKNKYLNFIDNFKLEKHFLCFNNLSKVHRLWMFYELMNNPKLKDKSIISLCKNTTNQTFYDIVSSTNNKELIEYYKTYDSTIGYSYDTTNWKKEVEVGDSINKEAHLKCFVNIVTETLTMEDVVFITEKTYKPIYTCQPFIITGNAFSLKKLKEYGFKTFDKWWDESYDDEINFEKRMNKITKLLEEIASWDLDKCSKIRNEMREILIHNYNQMLSKDEIIKFYSSIKTDTKNVKKSLL
jgi:hypothetical protein